VAAGLAIAAAGLIAAWSAGAFDGPPANADLPPDTTPVALATVTRGTLSSQVRQDGTLGFAGSYSVIGQARGIITALPAAGQVIRPGQSLYQVDGLPVALLDGATPAYRTLAEGDRGRDVAQLNADLVRLGDATRAEIGPGSDQYTAATATAAARLQAALGLRPGDPARHLHHPPGRGRRGRVAAGRGAHRGQGHGDVAGQRQHAGDHIVGRHRRLRRVRVLLLRRLIGHRAGVRVPGAPAGRRRA
jgi:hypothetical protein